MMQECRTVDGHAVVIEGSGSECLVMIHGWPDTFRLWDRQVAALAPHFRCVRFTLPGFAPEEPRQTWSIDALCAFFDHVLDAVSPDQPVTLVLHDWGCVFGYQYAVRRPGRVRRIVGVDIGDTLSLREEASPRVLLMVLAYQNWLALAWMIGGPIGDWMTRRMAAWLRCPTLGPQVGARQDYPYFMTWWARADSYRRHTRAFEPACPMLYVYGEHKPFLFHARAWVERLLRNPANRVVPFKTGHWVMVEQPDEFNRVLLDWLAPREHAVPPEAMTV